MKRILMFALTMGVMSAANAQQQQDSIALEPTRSIAKESARAMRAAPRAEQKGEKPEKF